MKKRGEQIDPGNIPRLREQKNTPPFKRKRKHKVPPEPNPLTVFLEQSPDGNQSRLREVAQRIAAQPFDLDRFRTNVVAKLKRFSYPQPPERDQHKKTFYDHLEVAKSLPVFWRPSNLRKMWDCLLLAQIVAEDRELEEKHLSVEKYPLAFYCDLADELLRHEKSISEIHQKYSVEASWMDNYLSLVLHQGLEPLRIVALSRFPGSRKEVLGGRRSNHTAVQEALFWTLKKCLKNSDLSDRFFQQLSVLISAPDNVKQLDSAEPLREALERPTGTLRP